MHEDITYQELITRLQQIKFVQKGLIDSHFIYVNEASNVTIVLPLFEPSESVPTYFLQFLKKQIVEKGILTEKEFLKLIDLRSLRPNEAAGSNAVSASVEELLLGTIERGVKTIETGRHLITFKEGVDKHEATNFLESKGLRVADARHFYNRSEKPGNAADEDVVFFSEIGVALLSGNISDEQISELHEEQIESIDPEYFAFAADKSSAAIQNLLEEYQEGSSVEPVRGIQEGSSLEYMRGFLRAAEAIAKELNTQPVPDTDNEIMTQRQSWGLNVCNVPQSIQSGLGIKVAVLDTGMNMKHPDYTGRSITSISFVKGQTGQDLHGHGTHCTGIACGPQKASEFGIPRYGIGFNTEIFAVKVLNYWGVGSQGDILAGVNWAIANRCPIIAMPFTSRSGHHPAYHAAGQAALNNGSLIIAAAGNENGPTHSPANSSTVMSVASLSQNLVPNSISNFGKVDIAGPGDALSSWPLPQRYHISTGTSVATLHVAGCAALWAETSSNLRSVLLWRKLAATARRLPYPMIRVGAGLVQAP